MCTAIHTAGGTRPPPVRIGFLNIAAALFLALLLNPTDVRAQAASWPNEPAGSQVVADCDFNDGSKTCGGKLTTYYPGGGVTNLPDAPYSPSGVYYNALHAWSSTGDGSQLTYIGSPNMKDMYVGFYWKMNADFEGYVTCNKLFFMRDGDNVNGPQCNTNGTFLVCGNDGIDARNFPFMMMFAPQIVDADSPCANEGLSCFPNIQASPINKDQWYLVEAYVKASSCATCNDGIARWWIDGVLQGNYETITYGCNTVDEFVFDHTWDGQPAAQCRQDSGLSWQRDCTKTWYHYLDHLHITAPDCPNGCPVTGNTGGGSTKVEKGKTCEPVPDVELYVEKDKPAPVGEAIKRALGEQ